MSAENEPAADPGQLLREVANADEGWSERYGGPEGIARWTLNLQDALKEQATTWQRSEPPPSGRC